jgi:xylulokinase
VYFLGLDVGTTACKAGLYDSEGRILAKSVAEYSVEVPRHGWAEQPADIWWEKAKLVIGRVLDKAGISGESVAAVAVSGQSPTVVPVDRAGRPLYNAILWMDRRAVEEARDIERVSGVPEDPFLALPKILWFKRNLPEVYRNTFKFLQATDYVTFKLSGVFATDWYNASTAHYSVERGSYDTKLLESLGIDASLLPDVYMPGTPVSQVCEEASRETGLSTKTLVVMGTIDAYAGLVGCGGVEDGIACDITGASTCILVSSAKKVQASGIFVEKHFVDGLWVISAIMSTTGASLKWFRENFAQLEKIIEELTQGSIDAYDLLTAEAQQAPPGAGGLVFLPYLAGERSPIWDPYARGVLFGISLQHKRSNVIRAILEGSSFAARHNLDLLKELGIEIKRYIVSGGASKSDFWNQLKADIIGQRVERLRDPDTSVIGAAVLASVGSGYFKTFSDACSSMVHTEREFNPRIELKDFYDKLFLVYVELYKRVKELYPKLPQLEKTG